MKTIGPFRRQLPRSPRPPRPARDERSVALAVLAAGSLLWMVACPLSKRLPSPSDVSLQEPLLEAPVQVDGDAPPIPAEKGGIHYTVQPVADYRLAGMVVSRHESDSFADYYHDVWGDKLNVADLCVVWGENLSKGYYRGIEFWSEPFTCNWQTRDEKAWASFRTNEISNNHLIAEDRGLRRRLLSVRVGDVVRIEGQLATYSNDRGFSRGTSRSREDTGNGACETVWVRNVEILRSANRGWILLRWLGGWSAIAGVVLLARWFARRPAFRSSTGAVIPRPVTTPPPPKLPDVWEEPPPGSSSIDAGELPSPASDPPSPRHRP